MIQKRHTAWAVCRFTVLLILSLACSLRLLLTLHAGLLVTLTLAKFSEDAGTCALTLEATQSTIQGFSLFYLYFCHSVSPPSRKPICRTGSPLCERFSIILYFFSVVNRNSKILFLFLERCYSPVTWIITTSQGLKKRGAKGTLLDVPREITSRPS